MRLTDRGIAALPTPERGQKLYTETTLPGFGIRVSQGGSKTFVLEYGAPRRRITLGRYPIVSLHAARSRAVKLLAEAQLGITHKPSPSFEGVREEYLDRRDVRESTRQGDRYLIKHFDHLGKHKVADITPEMIEAILDGIDAPTTRMHAFIRLRGLMSFALRRGYIDKSPLAALECPTARETRARVLSAAELAKVLTTARMRRLSGDRYGAIVELLCLTGQRRQQIAGLHRSMIDFDNKVIEWPASLMKNGRRHVIPLSPMAEALLDPKVNGLYFPNRNGDPFCGWSYHFRRFAEDIGFSDFVLHDIRRTLATTFQELGIEIATTEKLLSHSAITGGLVGIYQRSSYLAQMREALLLWEQYLEKLPPQSQVEGVRARIVG